MSSLKLGVILFWLGAAYVFVASWLVMWWLAPYWRATPPETLEGTALAFAGPVFMAIMFSVPAGIVLASVGMALYSGLGRAGVLPNALLLVGVLAISASVVTFESMPYYPNLFGILGGAIMVLFFASLWYWGRVRLVRGSQSPIADVFQLFSYLCFYLTATTACAMLGNPFGGLFFPEVIVNQDALPVYHSMGTKIAVYLAFGWFFTLASQYTRYRISFAANQAQDPTRAHAAAGG